MTKTRTRPEPWYTRVGTWVVVLVGVALVTSHQAGRWLGENNNQQDHINEANKRARDAYDELAAQRTQERNTLVAISAKVVRGEIPCRGPHKWHKPYDGNTKFWCCECGMTTAKRPAGYPVATGAWCEECESSTQEANHHGEELYRERGILGWRHRIPFHDHGPFYPVDPQRTKEATMADVFEVQLATEDEKFRVLVECGVIGTATEEALKAIQNKVGQDVAVTVKKAVLVKPAIIIASGAKPQFLGFDD